MHILFKDLFIFYFLCVSMYIPQPTTNTGGTNEGPRGGGLGSTELRSTEAPKGQTETVVCNDQLSRIRCLQYHCTPAYPCAHR
ncbi:hypothetical protein PF003_g39542 [Phytophthora fragariae]|nr:hypothetical protein PF003_g39542 [Phytophthora fragariae]